MEYLKGEGKAENTVKSYMQHIGQYLKWYEETYGKEFKQLYRANILDFVSYLRNIKKLDPRSTNAKVSSLISFNGFLIKEGIQDSHVITKKDMMKIQQNYASPATVEKKDIEEFRQAVLIHQGVRDHALVTLLAYSGLRISEALNIKLTDINIKAREVKIMSGKGDKYRVANINDVIANALYEYLRTRKSESEYLFVSRQADKLNRTRINQIFNKYSKKITPHTLRHFYCSRALETGQSIAEVAAQAGHSNVAVTLLYTNPSRAAMKAKANLL